MYSKFSIKHFDELTSPRVDQSATRLTASWFVGELSGYHLQFTDYQRLSTELQDFCAYRYTYSSVVLCMDLVSVAPSTCVHTGQLYGYEILKQPEQQPQTADHDRELQQSRHFHKGI